MTFNVRRMLQRTGRSERAALKRVDHPSNLNRGPHPELQPVFKRHPAWRKRLNHLMRLSEAERAELPDIRAERDKKAAKERARRRKP